MSDIEVDITRSKRHGPRGAYVGGRLSKESKKAICEAFRNANAMLSLPNTAPMTHFLFAEQVNGMEEEERFKIIGITDKINFRNIKRYMSEEKNGQLDNVARSNRNSDNEEEIQARKKKKVMYSDVEKINI